MSATTLDKIGELFAHALTPIGEAARHPEVLDGLLAALGWDKPPGVDLAMLMTLDASTVIDKLQAVLQSTPEERDDTDTMVARYGELTVAVAALIVDIGELADGLPAKLAAAGDYATKSKIKDELPRRLLDYLLVAALDQLAPPLHYALRTLGIVHSDPYPADASIYQVAHRRIVVSYDRFGTLFSKPGQLFVDVYGWGTASFDAESLLENLGYLIQSLGPRVIVRDMPQAAEEALGGRAMPEAAADPSPQLLVPMTVRTGPATADVVLSLHRLRATTVGATDAGIELAALVTGAAAVSIPFGDTLALAIDATVDLGGGAGIAVRPNGAQLHLGFLDTGTPSAGASGSLGVGLHRKRADGKPSTILSVPGGTRVEADDVSVTAGINLAVGKDPDPFVQAAIVGGHIIVTLGGADGFLSKVLPNTGIESRFDLKISWSRLLGLRFEGSGVLEIDIPVHATLGPFNLDVITLRLGIIDQALRLVAAVTGAITLGPVIATVQNIGLRADLGFKPGNLGPANLALGFNPPNGLGLAIDASVVSGGGFLSFDFDKQQYAGILQLSIQNVVDVKAIGILNARLPDGRPGYSLLLIITGEFPPIQLGMGFTLNGVGGLIAINRTVVVDVLRDGVRDGGLDAILFPPDPLSHVASLLGTLSAVFPVAENRYVFGPMVRIGWGSPTLITLDLALILEIPDPVRLIILGRLKAVLPNEKAPVVQLRLDAIGVLDFSRNEFSLDATLYDSRIVTFALTGDMALRLSWGSQPAFAMALGGFHPAFKPPPGFPALRRLALALSTGDNPRLRMESYFALTSNTVQVGARLELYVKIAAFSLEGGLGFDTLIQFSPFQLLADIDAHLALKRGSTTLMGLDINVHLMGPAPWVLWGQAKFKIFFVSFSIPFRATFGQSQDVPPIERKEVWPILRDSLTATANWSAQLPGDSGRLVTLRADAGGDDLLAHPLGTLAVSQNLVPLDRTLGLFGAVPPKDFDRFAIVAATGLDITDTTTQYFAPAQFRQMTDAEKLASPSFERMVSGARFAPHTAIAIGHVQDTPLDYEQAVILDVDQSASQRLDQRYTPAGATVAVLAEHGPAGTAAVRTQGRAKFAPPAPGPKIADPSYVIVTRDDLAPVAVDGLDGSYTSAAERLRQRADRDALQIVRAEELELT